MVGAIYFIEMPYSDFKVFKGRPVLVFKTLDKSDVLVLPLTTNLKRKGIVLSNKDLQEGSLKKESVVVVPKVTAVDRDIILDEHKIAVLKDEVFENVLENLCEAFGCSIFYNAQK